MINDAVSFPLEYIITDFSGGEGKLTINSESEMATSVQNFDFTKGDGSESEETTETTETTQEEEVIDNSTTEEGETTENEETTSEETTEESTDESNDYAIIIDIDNETLTGKAHLTSNQILTKSSDAVAHNCAYRYLPPKMLKNHASISMNLYKNSQNCGRCISLKCTHSQCTNSSPTLLVITDSCSGCGDNEVGVGYEIFSEVFKGLDSSIKGEIDVEYSFTTCNDLLEDSK